VLQVPPGDGCYGMLWPLRGLKHDLPSLDDQLLWRLVRRSCHCYTTRISKFMWLCLVKEVLTPGGSRCPGRRDRRRGHDEGCSLDRWGLDARAEPCRWL
jgi:hypothetical protein